MNENMSRHNWANQLFEKINKSTPKTYSFKGGGTFIFWDIDSINLLEFKSP